MSDSETQRLLGALDARLSSIEDTLRTANNDSRGSRAAVYDALREIREDAQDTRHRVAKLEQIIAEDVQPVIKGVRDWRSRAIGAAFVLGFIGSALIFLITSTKDLVIAAWQALTAK
ncbi:MAG: DUF1515 family protein [Rhodobacteraceae bacterium]|nr:DUF1515 family protein [Paracoccaceae bacterium]